MKNIVIGVAALGAFAVMDTPSLAQLSTVEYCRAAVQQSGCQSPQTFGLCVAFYNACENGSDTACARLSDLLSVSCSASCDQIVKNCIAPSPSVNGTCKAAVNACTINRGNNERSLEKCERKAAEFLDACGVEPDASLCEPCANLPGGGSNCDSADPGLSGAGLGCYPCYCTLSGTAPPPGSQVAYPGDCAAECPADATTRCSDNWLFVNCDGQAH